nr:MAG TPA: KTSC domain [Caudoviricetes sp.]
MYLYRMNIISSNIRTATYDRKKRELQMTFINRPRWVYTYYKVPPNIWTEFVRSDSKGQYFSQIIRDRFQYSRR